MVSSVSQLGNFAHLLYKRDPALSAGNQPPLLLGYLAAVLYLIQLFESLVLRAQHQAVPVKADFLHVCLAQSD